MTSTFWRKAMGLGKREGKLEGQRRVLALQLRERLGGTVARRLVSGLVECDQKLLDRALKLVAVSRADEELIAALEALIREVEATPPRRSRPRRGSVKR